MKIMNRLKRVTIEISTVLLALLFLSPIYIVFVNAFKSKKQVFLDQLGMPEQWHFENFIKAFEKMDFIRTFMNSITITTGSLIGLTLFSAMAAWVLVRNKSKTSSIIFYIFVAAMLIPFQSIMLPLVKLMGNLGMLNSRLGIIFMYLGFGASLSIFLYHGFIKAIPKDLEEAAIIDGCTIWEVFFKVVLPLLKPITMTVAVLNALWIWNDYMLPLLMLQEERVRTLPLQMKYFYGSYNKDWHLAMAALLMIIIPVVIFYVFAQKHIIKGVMSGSVKG